MSEAPATLGGMDAAVVVVLVLVAAAVGGAAGWFAHASRAGAALAQAHAQAAAAQAESVALREERDRAYDLHRDAVEHQRHEQQMLAERDRRQNEVLTALAPVRETLQRMQVTVHDLERERTTQFGTIAEQLRRAQESDEVLRATTASLAGALRSSSTRGVWGETQLRRIVEAAGLTRHVDFELQTTVQSDRGTGRPDMIVRLAGGKSLAVDAKAPLDAFLEASGLTDDDERRRPLMQRHVRAVRSHIDALAKKGYWTALESSPEFVICFLPSESLLSAALDEDPALLDYAFSKRVALASPVNLWAVLKTVAYTWTQQEATAEAKTLLDLGTQLYERLGVLAGHADDLRRAIERTVDSYNRFAGSLEGRVLVTARKFPGIDTAALGVAEHPDAAATAVTSATRRFTAEELTAQHEPAHVQVAPIEPADTTLPHTTMADSLSLSADLGEVRARVSAPAREGLGAAGHEAQQVNDGG